VNYVSRCQTRYGAYAFCDNMRLPSYSLAKSSFGGLAMMWLGQQYGSEVYGQLIRDYVPQYADGGDWTNVTFSNAADMATGNYISADNQADEGSPQELAFLIAEPYSYEDRGRIHTLPAQGCSGNHVGVPNPRHIHPHAGHEQLLAATAGQRVGHFQFDPRRRF
jgi:hypothetical protein